MHYDMKTLTNPEIITKNIFKIAFNDDFVFNTWLPALRSGKYQQGVGNLRRHTDFTDTYCCLGVGCDLWDPSRWHLELNRYLYIADMGVSPEFAAFVGLRDDNGSFYFTSDDDQDDYEASQCLSALNDDGYTFKQIADIIECHAKAALKQRGKS